MLKKCKVVMLPTNEKATIGSIILNKNAGNQFNSMFICRNETEVTNVNYVHEKAWKPVHLYFLSEDQIEVPDWCIMLDSFGNVFSVPQQYTNPETQFLNKDNRKIIATTDKSLCKTNKSNYVQFGINVEETKLEFFPEPSNGFIQKYVDSFNNGNVIDWVNVEYEYRHDDSVPYPKTLDGNAVLKVNPKDNTITIKPIKTGWSRDEVIIFIGKMISNGIVKPNLEAENFDTWIEKNL